jgi:hypothetical protein
MKIRPCSADRARALGRLRKGRPVRVRKLSENVLEVELACGCEVEIDFNDSSLTYALEGTLRRKMSAN